MLLKRPEEDALGVRNLSLEVVEGRHLNMEKLPFQKEEIMPMLQIANLVMRGDQHFADVVI